MKTDPSYPYSHHIQIVCEVDSSVLTTHKIFDRVLWAKEYAVHFYQDRILAYEFSSGGPEKQFWQTDSH